MADDNLPKAAAAASREEEDADFDETQDDGEDCEATMDEEEALEQGDYVDELKELEDDNELSIEELRRKYGYGEPLPEPSGEKASSSTAAGKPEDYFSNESFEDEEEEEGEDIDYAPPDLWKKEVRVHPDEYQAVIPDFTGDTVFESEPDDDQCKLWGAAGSDEAEAQTLVREFIRKVVDKRVEAGQLNDPQRVNST
ncbi:hypothetical protein WR25_18550 [Diploscapter pachys]|uniref:ELM2 domain-containing protein n=1 Tax=Diploscapter pachys TaxID=2018661 RepID=A0A2A2LGN0_9BILA|nr:hypothetical protein WR25_18550 [Diploscapter pachys]